MACQLTFLLSTINQAKAVDRRPPFWAFHAGTAGQPRSQAHDIREMFFFVRRFPKYVMTVGSVPLVNCLSQKFFLYTGQLPRKICRTGLRTKSDCETWTKNTRRDRTTTPDSGSSGR